MQGNQNTEPTEVENALDTDVKTVPDSNGKQTEDICTIQENDQEYDIPSNQDINTAV